MTTTASKPQGFGTLMRLLEDLREPAPASTDELWLGESLASGAAGTALAHIESAHTTASPSQKRQRWENAHRWIQAAASGGVSATDACGLFIGAPALAFTLHTAGRYHRTTPDLLEATIELAHRRVDHATRRRDSDRSATFAEYDTFYGLTGLGALLLDAAPGDDALERVLTHLVSLARPRFVDGHAVPGWWVDHDPRRGHSPQFPGGHANFGMAHGMTGILAMLACAKRAGATVHGHDEAILALLEHLGEWAQEGPAGTWWPEHLTLQELNIGRPQTDGPARPSWCYGTPGIARAGQLAALAIEDRDRQMFFEHALDRCLSDEVQLSRIRDAGLCHGWAGLFQTVWRTASEAASPRLAAHLPHLASVLAAHAETGVRARGLLEGSAGSALALMTATSDTAPACGWDTCLLIA